MCQSSTNISSRVSIPPRWEWGWGGEGVLYAFQHFCKLFIFGKSFGVLRDRSYKFYLMTFIWLTIYMQTETCITFFYFSLKFLAYFVLLKDFLAVFYFNKNLLERESV